ncbi:hypothetical protein PT282_04245 [Bifidobacterium sp. ESL0763]|uniref:hypothetical protein n=1 Tax=Bifidobacterium sp. ESL0763 TaxID=2983227 RepID=UPI0023FA3462|nr:hypothetical protein [Bifidobacterium sp. ESL0763]MDF7663873.1 hypothetical protein [Bifidobacterium sp. ESL0763]
MMLQDVLVILIVLVLLLVASLLLSALFRKDRAHRRLKLWAAALLGFFTVILIVCRLLT